MYLLLDNQLELMIDIAEADKLQLFGIDVDKNAVQRIECGKRFVTDIELVAIAKVLEVSVLEFLSQDC